MSIDKESNCARNEIEAIMVVSLKGGGKEVRGTRRRVLRVKEQILLDKLNKDRHWRGAGWR